MTYDEQAERLYDVRAAVATYDEDTACWVRRSAAFRDRVAGQLDIAYGDGPSETLDIFPAARSDAPLHMFIHGGYWRARDKSEFSFLAEPYVAAGVSVAIVNYALCPLIGLGEMVDQVRRAFCWLHRHAGDFGADPGRIQISGHSAGAHLAAMLLATDWRALDSDLPDAPIASAILVSGLYDLTKLVRTSINEALQLDMAAARRLSPLAAVPRSRPPTILAVGEDEGAGFRAQCDALAGCWSPEFAILNKRILDRCNHLSALEALADRDHPLFVEAIDLGRS